MSDPFTWVAIGGLVLSAVGTMQAASASRRAGQAAQQAAQMNAAEARRRAEEDYADQQFNANMNQERVSDEEEDSKIRAGLLAQNEFEATQDAEIEAARVRQNDDLIISGQIADVGKSGFTMEGSPEQAIWEAEKNAEYNVLMIKRGGKRVAQDYHTQELMTIRAGQRTTKDITRQIQFDRDLAKRDRVAAHRRADLIEWGGGQSQTAARNRTLGIYLQGGTQVLQGTSLLMRESGKSGTG
jgi:hypothetical protein